MFGTLYKQWLDLIEEYLTKEGFKIDELQRENIDIQYFDYKNRGFDLLSYKVFFSKEILKNPLYKNFEDVIKTIKKKVENKEDLNIYLSKLRTNPQKPDSMLNDWGVLHLHLGDTIENGVVKITSELLYIYRDKRSPENLYFIDIFDHNSWTDEQAMEIVCKNWKELLEPHKITGLVDISPIPTSDELKCTRKENINSAVKICGNHYITIGGGETMGGTNLDSTFKAIQLRKYFYSIERELLSKHSLGRESLRLKLEEDEMKAYIDLPDNSTIVSNLFKWRF